MAVDLVSAAPAGPLNRELGLLSINAAVKTARPPRQ
jgi:hypothetical protein